jgi:endoplasmic reticulum chaperone BiP
VAADDKKTILAAVKEASDWIEENGATATAEEFEDKLGEVQAVVNPITAKMYGGEEDSSYSHDEL